MTVARCRFCALIESDEVVISDTYAAAFHDGFPSAPGHVLIVPTRHVKHVRELEPYEWQALWQMAYKLIAAHEGDLTIGINDGPRAGQTIPHVHLHLIPRTEGDVPDPRGGIRWVIPSTAAYWTPSQEPAHNNGGVS